MTIDKLGNTIPETEDECHSSQKMPNDKLIEKKTVYSIHSLPLELLIVVFSHMDPSSLKKIALVCKKWYQISLDNSVWLQIFRTRYPHLPLTFSSVSRSTSWKEELIKRETYVKNWRKGRGFHTHYSLTNLMYVSDLYTDFKNNRMLTFDTHTGRLLSCNINNGAYMDSDLANVPSGTTAFDMSKHFIIYGRWDGKISGSLVNHKNLLMSGVKEFDEPEHQGMITCVTLIKKDLAKLGKIGGFTGDQHGNLRGWDLKKGEKILSLTLSDASIIRIESNGKDAVAVLNNIGELYVIKNVFDIFESKPEVLKIYTFESDTDDELISVKMFVDYGGEKIILHNNHKLEIISYNSENLGNLSVLPIQPNDIIYKASLEQNDIKFSPRDTNLVGGDPLMMAVLLKTGKVMVINVRSNEYDITPVIAFYPKLINDSDFRRMIRTDPNIDLPPLSTIAINSLVVMVGSYNGKFEFYDTLNGQFCRGYTERLSKKTLQLIGNQLLPISNISIHQSLSAGIVTFGPIVQFFKFGDFYQDLDKKNRKKRNGNGDRKPSSNNIKASMEDYEIEDYQKKLKYAMLDKYNGPDLEDSDEELQMAIALSASMNNSSANINNSPSGNGSSSNNNSNNKAHAEVDEDLLRALESSKFESTESDDELTQVLELSKQTPSSRTSTTITAFKAPLTVRSISDDSNDDNDDALDEDLKRALELSRAEYIKFSKQPLVQENEDDEEFDADNDDDYDYHDKDAEEEEEEEMDEDLRLAIELSKHDHTFDWKKQGSSDMQQHLK